MISNVYTDRAGILIVTSPKYTTETYSALRRKRRQYYVRYLALVIKFILKIIPYYRRK